MKSKEERKALHRTQQKNIRSDNTLKQSNASRVTKDGGELYQEVTVDGQKLYHQLSTKPIPASGAVSTIIENLTVQGGTSDVAAGGGSSAHPDLTGVSADQHHAQIHSMNGADHVGELTVLNGGTNASTFTDKAVLITQDSGTDTVSSVAMDGNGELLIGGTSGPAVNTLTGTINQVTVTNADGGITLSAPQNLHTGASPQFTGLTLTSNITMGDDTSIGIGDSAERIEFDGNGDISFLGCNVGIGTATPDSILHVQDSSAVVVEIESTGANASLRINAQTGSPETGLSTLYFDSDPDGGDHEGSILYDHDSTNTDQKMQFKVADNAVTAITILGSGNVGIGTASPSYALEVNSGIGNTALSLISTDPSATIRLADDTTSNNKVFTRTGDNLAICEEGGNVGIGLDEPAHTLHVYNDASAAWVAVFDNNHEAGLGVLIDVDADGVSPALRITEVDNVLFEVQADGFVGIGTSSPNSTLTVASATGGYMSLRRDHDTITGDQALGAIYFVGTENSGSNLGYGAAIFGFADEAWAEGSAEGTYLSFHTTDNTTAVIDERVRIDHNGKVGIGTIAPSELFHVKQSNGAGGAMKLKMENADTDEGVEIEMSSSTTWQFGTGRNDIYDHDDNFGFYKGGTRLVLDRNGKVGIGEAAPDTTLEVLSGTTNQLKLSFANGTDTTFGTDTNGYLTITPSGSKIFVANEDSIGSTTYSSGFFGGGWIIDDKTTVDATFDNLNIRGTLSVYELLIQQIRCTNGSLMISSVAKVEAIGETGSGALSASNDAGTITFESTTESPVTCPFLINDIIMCQRVNPGAFVAPDAAGNAPNVIKKLVYKVASVSTNVCTVANILYDNITAPAVGDDFVRIGNTGTAARQSVMYLTSDDTNAPFIDMKADINSYADWHANDSVKLRLGRLDGLSAGGTNEYGLFAGPSDTNYIKAGSGGVFLKGSEDTYLKATANTIEFFDVAADTNSYKKMDITGGSIKMYAENGNTVMTEWNNETLTFGGPTGNETYGITISSGGVTCWGDSSSNYVNVDNAAVTIRADGNNLTQIHSAGMDVYWGNEKRAIFGTTTVIGSSTLVATDSTDDCIRISDGAINIFKDSSNKSLIDGDGLTVWAGGGVKLEARTGGLTCYGNDTTDYISITDTGLVVYKAGQQKASFGANTLITGGEIILQSNSGGDTGDRIVIGSASIALYTNNNKLIDINDSGINIGPLAVAGTAVRGNVRLDTNGVFVYGAGTDDYVHVRADGVDIVTAGTTAMSLTAGNIAMAGIIEITSTGSQNVMIGKWASTNPDVSGVTNNVVLGTEAGKLMESGAEDNVIIGTTAGDAITTGKKNVAVGNNALSALSSSLSCVAIGSGALRDTTGNYNIGIGASAGVDITTGTNNIAIGSGSLEDHGNVIGAIAIGKDAGMNHATAGYMGNYSICIGERADVGTDNDTESVVIGRQAIGKGSNRAYIASSQGFYVDQDIYSNNSKIYDQSTKEFIGTTLDVTGAVECGSLDCAGSADIDGTCEADAYTVNGVALSTYISQQQIGASSTFETSSFAAHTGTSGAGNNATLINSGGTQGSINLGIFIIKWGRIDGNLEDELSTSETETFTAAFPNSCQNLQCTFDVIEEGDTSGLGYAPGVTACSKTGFTISTSSAYEGVFWFAIGH